MLKSREEVDINKEKAEFDAVMSEGVTSEASGWKKRLEIKEWKDDLKLIVHTKNQKDSKNDIFRVQAKYRNIKLD